MVETQSSDKLSSEFDLTGPFTLSDAENTILRKVGDALTAKYVIYTRPCKVKLTPLAFELPTRNKIG